MFFLYTRGRQLSPGNAIYGFIQDGTNTGTIARPATGVQGQVNKFQIKTQGAAPSGYGAPSAFIAPLPQPIQLQIESYGLIDGGSSS